MTTYNLEYDNQEYVFFIDKRNVNDFYVMSKNEHKKYNDIINDYGRDNEKVPDGVFILAIQLGRVKENTFGFVNKVEINFPVNKIEWKIVKLGGQNM